MSLKKRREKWRDRARRLSNWIDKVHEDKKNRLRYLKYLAFPFALIFVALMAFLYCCFWFIERVIDLLHKFLDLISR
jgi:hypothetical protein